MHSVLINCSNVQGTNNASACMLRGGRAELGAKGVVENCSSFPYTRGSNTTEASVKQV